MLTLWSRTPNLRSKPEFKHLLKYDPRFILNENDLTEQGADDLLVVMGTSNLKEVQAAGLLPKNRTISSMREVLHPIHEGRMLITFDPGIQNIDYTNYVKMQTDLMLAERYAKKGHIEPTLGDYHWVQDFEHLPERINTMYNLTGRPVRVAMDLETVGLDPFNSDKFIVTISFSIEEGMSDLVRFKGADEQPGSHTLLWDQINWLLNDDRISLVGANLKFDLMWVRVKWGMLCTNFKFDTTLVGSILDENRSNSLNTHAKIYCPDLGGYDDPLNQKHDKSRMDLVGDDDMLPYAGGDTDATLQVANIMATHLIRSKKMTNFYTKLLHPCSRGFEDMEYTGVLMDQEYFAGLQAELFAEMDGISNEVWEIMPKRIQAKYRDNWSLTRGVIIEDYMFSHPKGLGLTPKMFTAKDKKPSTAFDHLKMFEDVPEAVKFVELFKRWNSAKKTESTYITGFFRHLREDGRLHPTAILYRGDYDGGDSGTVTGRLAFKDPASQTIPKHTKWAKPLRKGYIAPPGYCVMNWDYSQGELRVIACLAHEEAMIKAYRDNIDLHLKTGGELNGYTLDQAMKMKAAGDPLIKKIRQGGKAGNFGLIYDISPEGFVIYARDTYGVELSLKEAIHQQSTFFGIYPKILDYQDEMREHAKRKGWVMSPLGRVRHLPMIHSDNWGEKSKAQRQAINSPVQSTLSDLSCLALSEFKINYGYPEGCKFFLMTHDALTAYVQLDEVDYWAYEIKAMMENLPITEYFGWKPQLPFLVDIEVGPTFGSMEEMGDHPGKSVSDVILPLRA